MLLFDNSQDLPLDLPSAGPPEFGVMADDVAKRDIFVTAILSNRGVPASGTPRRSAGRIPAGHGNAAEEPLVFRVQHGRGLSARREGLLVDLPRVDEFSALVALPLLPQALEEQIAMAAPRVHQEID